MNGNITQISKMLDIDIFPISQSYGIFEDHY